MKTLPARRASVDRYRNKHKALGLCISCSLPAVQNKVFCERHLRAMRDRYDERKRKYLGPVVKEKSCCWCKEVLTSASFSINRASEDGLQAACRSCTKQRNKLNYTKKRIMGLCTAKGCYELTDAGYAKCTKHRQEDAVSAKVRNRKLRLAALNAYGNKCSCCNEDNEPFLAIDHINGGGRNHREELKEQGISFYRWLKDNGYPQGFRVLCHNCNMSFGLYGFCPHQTCTSSMDQSN